MFTAGWWRLRGIPVGSRWPAWSFDVAQEATTSGGIFVNTPARQLDEPGVCEAPGASPCRSSVFFEAVLHPPPLVGGPNTASAALCRSRYTSSIISGSLSFVVLSGDRN